MLTPENKQKWIEALRSGKYSQTQRVLRRDEDDSQSYCCLGVFCDLVAPDKWVSVASRAGYSFNNIFDSFKSQNSTLVLDLIRMNDVEDKNFAEIADYVEQYQPD